MTEVVLSHCDENSDFGKLISKIACDTKYHTYLEIGTMRGQGTTKCFLDGLLPREDDWSFYTLESDLECYETATSFWSSLSDDTRVNFLRGGIASISETEEYYNNLISSEDSFLKMGVHWYDKAINSSLVDVANMYGPSSEPFALALQSSPYALFQAFWRQEVDKIWEDDIRNQKLCPDVKDKLPASIDVVLLDGGPFSTESEFKQLVDRTSVFILDDTNTSKTITAVASLEADPNWKKLIKNDEDRNGFAVYEKVNGS